MNENLQLPIHKIEGTAFLVDVSRRELREAARPTNTISFDDMTDKGTHYELWYDKLSKNVPTAYNRNKVVVRVEVPPMTQLHPEGMAARYQVRRTDIEQRRDADLILNEQLYQQRIAGTLPEIRVRGVEYQVQVENNLLKRLDQKHPGIDLREFELYNSGESLMAFYNTKTEKVVKLNLDKLTELPADVIMLLLPSPARLDPVGVAKQFWPNHNDSDDDIRKFVSRNPIHPKLKAQEIPLKNTPVAKMVEQNLNRLPNPAVPQESKRRQRGPSL